MVYQCHFHYFKLNAWIIYVHHNQLLKKHNMMTLSQSVWELTNLILFNKIKKAKKVGTTYYRGCTIFL